tara:strand:+ start:302 stop:451 length:150 start_codon:yes stop_codon:yes gene_type:complete
VGYDGYSGFEVYRALKRVKTHNSRGSMCGFGLKIFKDKSGGKAKPIPHL